MDGGENHVQVKLSMHGSRKKRRDATGGILNECDLDVVIIYNDSGPGGVLKPIHKIAVGFGQRRSTRVSRSELRRRVPALCLLETEPEREVKLNRRKRVECTDSEAPRRCSILCVCSKVTKNVWARRTALSAVFRYARRGITRFRGGLLD
jgi:hypothetical protein